MNFVITGANGFIGSSLTKRLIEAGHDVYAVDISFANDRLGDNPKIHKIDCFIDDLYSKKDLLPKCNAVFFHLAWQGINGPSKSDPLVQCNNISMVLSCAKIAKELGYKKILCAGTVAENGVESLSSLNSTSGSMLYGTAKECAHLMLETYCKSVGLDFVWMQFANIYGPKNKTGNLVSYTLGELLSGKEALFGPALQPYDLIYIDDLIEAIYRLGVSETKKNFYYIGSGKPRLLKDYLLEIGRKCNKLEMIKIGLRVDDGIKYSFDMFDNSALVSDIGDYISGTFEENIAYTIKHY